jgi:hypothetical protein
MLYLVILLVMAGLVLFAAGFLGESLSGISDRIERLEKLAREQNREDRGFGDSPQAGTVPLDETDTTRRGG